MFHGMTEVTDSPIFCDETEKRKPIYVKIVVNNNSLRKHYCGKT